MGHVWKIRPDAGCSAPGASDLGAGGGRIKTCKSRRRVSAGGFEHFSEDFGGDHVGGKAWGSAVPVGHKR
jgi:hypothetical protein